MPTAGWRPRRRGPWRGPLPLLGGLLALYLLVPIGALGYHLATGSGTAPSPGLGSSLRISLLTATISAAIIALFGIPLAWVLAQRRGRIWGAIGVAVQLPLALPPLMSGILLIEVFGPYTFIGKLTGGRLTDTTAAIVVAQTFVAAPFLVIAARSAFEGIDPRLTDVAATLGHGGWSRFWRVSLPIAGPGVRAGLLLSWLRAFGEFGATVILAYHPYSLPVFTFVQFSSTGLPTALPPTGVAILAAAVVLTVVLWRPERLLRAGWQRATGAHGAVPASVALESIPAPAGRDVSRPPARLEFDLSARVGTFELRLAHTGASAHLALLGPSGAGKSLTLSCLAGLRPQDVGRVKLGGRDLAELKAEHRRIGWVPQDAALIPHLDVWRQVTFGVGADPAVAAAWLQRLGIAELTDRMPDELSGGQRQRVALARALAREPDLLLLDEPLTALDRPVRDELRRELRRVQREAGIATVLVTHEPEEAAMLADEVVVISGGRELQSGTREAVFERPRSREVARLLAIDNLRTGQIQGPGTLLSEATEVVIQSNGLGTGVAVSWCIRAERVLLDCADEADVLAPAHRAVIEDVLDLGALRELIVTLDGGLQLTARAMAAGWQEPGARCLARLTPRDITIWTDDGAAPAAESAR
ncbi:MAG: ATP-binding cassette domain-containing protein [Solirubrobacteraceae bacterium]